jgi:HSP20 family protein
MTKEPESEGETTNVVTPEVSIDHDDKMFYVDVELPGVAKGHVDLSVGEQSICVEATREDVVFLGCFSLAHSVDENQAKAKFENGLLRIQIPLKTPLRSKLIKIE